MVLGMKVFTCPPRIPKCPHSKSVELISWSNVTASHKCQTREYSWRETVKRPTHVDGVKGNTRGWSSTLGLRASKLLLSAGLMTQEEKKSLERGAMREPLKGKSCYGLREAAPTLQLWSRKKNPAARRALVSLLHSVLRLPLWDAPVARKPDWYIWNPGQRERDWMAEAA